MGLGVGWFQSAAYALMLGSVPSERFGTASGAMSLAQASGTVLCVAIVGAIFAALSERYEASRLPAGDGVPAGLPGRVQDRSGDGGAGRDMVRGAGAAAEAVTPGSRFDKLILRQAQDEQPVT